MKSLDELDAIMQREYERLMALRQQTIDAEWQKVRTREDLADADDGEVAPLKERFIEEKAYLWDRISKSLEIYLADGATVPVDNFHTAFRLSALENAVANGFAYEVRGREWRSKVQVSRRSETLDIQVSPETAPESRDAFVSLRQWAHQYAPPRWQRLWSSLSGWQWFAWIFILLIAASLVTSSDDLARVQLRQNARALLETGVTNANVAEAVELLLAIEAGYVPGAPPATIPTWLSLLFWVGLVVCIILTFRPKVEMGIGRGVERIKLWRQWLNIIGVTVPGLIFASFIWPYIVRTINTWTGLP